MLEKPTLLNLGCGSRFHPDWINIDLLSRSPTVIRYDLSRGIPMGAASCDVVYHAAVLEHMRRRDAEEFLAECYRVLKVEGILRVGVPDLEKICRLYLSKMAAALDGDEAAAYDYEWIILEMLDQTVRERGGGGMLDYLRHNPIPNETFVYERIGQEGRELVKALRSVPAQSRQGCHPIRDLLDKLRIGLRKLPSLAKHRILCWLLGADAWRAFEIGRFRLAGEVHHWMYDRYSLSRLLEQTGFHEPQLLDANTSRILNWASFCLDTLPDGQAIKPDLLFVEAVKPTKSSSY